MPRAYWLLALTLALYALLGAAQAPPPAKHASPTIPLSTKLRFVIRPTLLGLVPPDDPLDFGEVLVRVVSLNGQALGLRYEIKERVRKEVPLAGLPPAPQAKPEQRPSLLPERSRPRPVEQKADPLMKQIDATRIRRGLITAGREEGVHRLDAPLYWDDGDWQTSSGAMWLSRTAYTELRDSGATAWDVQPAAWGASHAAVELAQAANARRQALGLAADAALRLELTSADVRYPVIVNGVRADVPALLAKDSLGLARYWILADVDNPLVLKLTYMPPETASTVAPQTAAPAEPAPATTPAAEAPASEAAPAAATAEEAAATPAEATPAAQPDPRRKRGLLPSRRAGGADAAPGSEHGGTDRGTPAAELAKPDLISAGAGFAIVEINF